MKTKYRLQFKRRRLNKTNYKKRFQLLESNKKRLVVRITNHRIVTHIVEYNATGDKTLVTADSKELKWNHSLTNTAAAYLAGLLCASKAKKKNIKESILDIGLKTPVKGCRVFAALKGALDGGLNVAHSPEKLPSEERIKGKFSDFEKVKNDILKK